MTFFLGCMALFLYFLCQAVIKYFDRPINTKFTYSTQAKLNFPSVTICNYNIITASYLAEKNDAMLNATVPFLGQTPSATGLAEPTPEQLEYMKTLDAAEVYSEGAHQFQPTFLSCTFPGVQSQFLSCELPDGLMVQTRTDMGVCFTFHPQSYIKANGTLKSTRAGGLGGLSILMNINQYEYRVGANAGGAKVIG